MKCLATFGAPTSGAPTCVLGQTSSKNAWVLFGDSHAWQWEDVLSNIATARGVALYIYARSGCPPEIASIKLYLPSGATSYPACDAWRTNVLQSIKALKPSEIIFSELTSGTTPSLDLGFTALVPQLIADVSGNKSHVVWLRSTSVLASSGQGTFAACLARTGLKEIKSQDGSTGCYTTLAIATGAKNYLDLVAAKMLTSANAAGISIIDPMPWLCQTTSAAGICPSIIDSRGVYFDEYHLANSYAQWLKPLLTAALPR
jgi:hypothetical protein